MDFIASFDKVSYPIQGDRGAAIGHEKGSHGGIMPHLLLKTVPKVLSCPGLLPEETLLSDLLLLDAESRSIFMPGEHA